MKELIVLETYRFPKILFFLNVVIFTAILYITFSMDTTQQFTYESASYFFIILFMVIGLPFGTIFLLSFNKDLNNGVFLSYLSLPYSPSKIVLSKYISYSLLFLISLYIPFLFVSPLLVNTTLENYIIIGGLILYTMLILSTIMLASLCMGGETGVVFYIFYLFFVSFFVNFLPLKYQYLIYPLNYFIGKIPGMLPTQTGSGIYAYISSLIYLGTFVITLIMIDKKQWGRIL